MTFLRIYEVFSIITRFGMLANVIPMGAFIELSVSRGCSGKK